MDARRLRVLGASSVVALLALGSGCARAHASADAPAPVAVRMLALGDSFTIGTGSGPARAFPARLASRWACPVDLRNVAVNGYTTQDVIDLELPQVAAHQPTLVTLAVGANDIVQGSSADAYRARVRRILAAVARGAGRPPEIVVLPQPDWALSPAASGFGEPAQIEARIIEFNGILREETAAAGGTFVDLFALMQTQARARMLAGDGLHPSAAAYDAWAAELARRVASPCSPRLRDGGSDAAAP
jgi:lysophospholipase L1-like esterase